LHGRVSLTILRGGRAVAAVAHFLFKLFSAGAFHLTISCSE
jgi:hypothetical protein